MRSAIQKIFTGDMPETSYDIKKIVTILLEELRDRDKRIEMQLQIMTSNIEDVKGEVEEIGINVSEAKQKTFVGKKPVFLQTTLEEVSKIGHKEIRQLIYRAANNQQKGYTRIYSKLSEITGIDIYQAGKSRITKKDGLGFTNGGVTYINTLFIKGVEHEAAAVALDIIRNK